MKLPKLYDRIKVKATGVEGNIVEVDDDGGTKPEIYLIELDIDSDSFSKRLRWCDYDEIELL